MIETRRPTVSRAVQMINHPIPKGVDITSKDPAIPFGKCRALKNVKVEDGRVTSVGVNTTDMPDSNVSTLEFAFDLISGGVRWAIYRDGTTCRVVNMDTGSAATVKQTSGASDQDFTLYTRATPYENGFLAYGGSSAVIFCEPISGTWRANVFGLESPEINGGRTQTEIYPAGAPGTYQYGVEFLVLSGGVVTQSSGVSRRTITGEIFAPMVKTAAAAAAVVYVEVPQDTVTWTHLALWRSKNLEEVDGFIAGNTATLYQLARYAKGTLTTVEYSPGLFRYELPYDVRPDTQLPGDPAFVDVIPTTPEVLELERVSSFYNYGYVSNSKLVMGALPDDPYGVYFSAARYGSKYSGQYSPSDRISITSQYGLPVGLEGLGDDLIVIAQNQVYRVPNADFESPIIPLGSPGYLVNFRTFKMMEGFGLVCIPSDKVIRSMDLNFQWKDEVGQRNADGIKDAFSDYNPVSDRLLATFSRGVLSLGISNRAIHYVLEPGQGWTQRQTDVLGVALNWALLDSGAGEPFTLVRQATLDTVHLVKFTDTIPTSQDYDSVSEMILGPFQANMLGDGVVEFLEFQIEGSFSDTGPVLTVIDGTGSDTDYTFTLVSVENSTDTKARTHTYKVTDASPGISRPVAQRLFVKIVTTGLAFTFNAFRFKAIVQQGGQAPNRATATTEANNLALQIAFQNSLVMRFTRPDPTTDFYGNGDLTES